MAIFLGRDPEEICCGTGLSGVAPLACFRKAERLVAAADERVAPDTSTILACSG
jgi:hypothetical protein